MAFEPPAGMTRRRLLGALHPDTVTLSDIMRKRGESMIARQWHGAVPIEKSDAYLEKMRVVALPGYRKVEGNRGAWVLHRIEGDIAHFDMLTFWDDVDAIKRFAGEDYEVAYYFDFDSDFLMEKEAHVRHWEMYAD
jgi:hypothetical protein